MPQTKRPSKFSQWSYIFEEWDRWLDKLGLTAYEACLRFAINQKEVDRVVVGIDSANQLIDLANSLGGPLESLPEFNNLIDNRLINPAFWGRL